MTGFQAVVDMVFIRFHVTDADAVFLTDFMGELLDIGGNTFRG